MLEERVRLTSEGPARISAAGRLRDAVLVRWLPVVAIVGIAFGVTAIWARSIHTFSVMPDELGYVKQAIQIWRTALPVGPHDFYFNSWAQLLPLISAPLFGGLGMAHAYYTAHTLYAFLLASTAIPAYLLARELRLGRLAASLVAALSVAVPWMVLAGLVMTEVVAYPVFAWAVLAMVRALDAPSARRDVLAIAAIALAFFARTQFLVLGPILVVATLLHDLGPAVAASRGRGAGVALASAGRRTLAAHRVLWVFAGLGLIVLLGLVVTGSLENVLGSYITPVAGAAGAGRDVHSRLQGTGRRDARDRHRPVDPCGHVGAGERDEATRSRAACFRRAPARVPAGVSVAGRLLRRSLPGR